MSDNAAGIIVIVIVIAFVALAGGRGMFVSEQVAIDKMETQGFTDVEVTGKEWLFVGLRGCGNDDAADNAAIMYSLFGCCKVSDVNPREWLTDVLTRIPEYNANYDLDLADLLPHNWQSEKVQENPTKLN